MKKIAAILLATLIFMMVTACSGSMNREQNSSESQSSQSVSNPISSENNSADAQSSQEPKSDTSKSSISSEESILEATVEDIANDKMMVNTLQDETYEINIANVDKKIIQSLKVSDQVKIYYTGKINESDASQIKVSKIEQIK